MTRYKKILVVSIGMLVVGILYFGARIVSNFSKPTGSFGVVVPKFTKPEIKQDPVRKALVDPLVGARSRVTKKPFGIKVSPGASPVERERFSGYHTGIDLEVWPEELNKEVSVRALCDGKVVDALRVSGYGGVLIESCVLDQQEVLVLYGHLKLSSIILKKNLDLLAGDSLGVLGEAHSSDTDQERKHLHLGIIKGKNLDFKGYVQDQAALEGWLDPINYLEN